RNTVLRHRPRRNAIASPVCRFFRNSKILETSSSVSRFLQCRGREEASAKEARPPSRYRFIHFLAVRRLTPNPAATVAAGLSRIRCIISSRPLAVSLAFLWLFTFSLDRFAVVC
ncbi:hypothetical protein, partial [Desulfovibrio desulfuricans]|uniref:hypothetical protein n=1 Tax=Desulfovibrio desulfuricans TaxID=876 RepID=UPI003FA23440